MSIHRFHTKCDIENCGNRSDEYTAFPTCQDCMRDICPEHAEPDTTTEPDLDAPPTCICVECWKENHEDNGGPDIDEDYERAAEAARGNDFEDTDGKDWT